MKMKYANRRAALKKAKEPHIALLRKFGMAADRALKAGGPIKIPTGTDPTYPEFPDPMLEADQYWNPGAKRTFKIIEENCPSKYYNEQVLEESRSFINYGN